MAKTIGIDLGTTNSCMAVLEGGEPVLVVGEERLADAVAGGDDDHVVHARAGLVGGEAYRMLLEPSHAEQLAADGIAFIPEGTTLRERKGPLQKGVHLPAFPDATEGAIRGCRPEQGRRQVICQTP